MEYTTSINMQLRTFVSCKGCKLWFPVESDHMCLSNINTVVQSYNIHWDF